MHGVLKTRDRIIPARAGFTTKKSRVAFVVKDHPRSRGVYFDVEGQARPIGGSSPLARGLLAESAGARVAERIIPARAGFTPRRQHHGGQVQDHPRSRGVYCDLSTILIAPQGSSPLARGLRALRSILWIARRIIPARAGFTPY